MKLKVCEFCKEELKTNYDIYYCPICKQGYTNNIIGLRKLYERINKKRMEILFASSAKEIDSAFWMKFLSVSSVIEKLLSCSDNATIFSSQSTREDICTFLLMCKEIDEKYPI